jgi:hypothetical protein
MGLFPTSINRETALSLLIFANFCRESKAENIKRIILNILYKAGNHYGIPGSIGNHAYFSPCDHPNNNLLDSLLYNLVYGDFTRNKIALPQATVILLIFMKDDLYNPANWKKVYNSLLIHQELSNQIRKMFIYLSFSVIMLFILFFFKIFLIKSNSPIENILTFTPNIIIVIFSLLSLEKIKKTFHNRVNLLYFLLALFNPSGSMKMLQHNHYFRSIPEYHYILSSKNTGHQQRYILSLLSLGGMESSIHSFNDLNNIIEEQVNHQLGIYKEKITNYLALFSQLFLIGIIGTALFITLDSARKIKKRYGIYDEIFALKKSHRKFREENMV